jgi:hypothetical protein
MMPKSTHQPRKRYEALPLAIFSTFKIKRQRVVLCSTKKVSAHHGAATESPSEEGVGFLGTNHEQLRRYLGRWQQVLGIWHRRGSSLRMIMSHVFSSNFLMSEFLCLVF